MLTCGELRGGGAGGQRGGGRPGGPPAVVAGAVVCGLRVRVRVPRGRALRGGRRLRALQQQDVLIQATQPRAIESLRSNASK